MSNSNTLQWTVNQHGEHTATIGATTYLISLGIHMVPWVKKWKVYLTHVEMGRDENGDTDLLYRGWGHDLDDAKALAQLIADSPIGDDTARMEWNRSHAREFATETH